MQGLSTLAVEYVERKQSGMPQSQHVKAAIADAELSMRGDEKARGLRHSTSNNNADLVDTETREAKDDPQYTFGDEGSHWRMTKLRATYRQAKDTGRAVEEVAIQRYGDLRHFDDAREEQMELERRELYGRGYIGRHIASGDLYRERMIQGEDASISKEPLEEAEDVFETTHAEAPDRRLEPLKKVDQTGLNKLKAQMMKAKLKNSPETARLELEYKAAIAEAVEPTSSEVVVLSKMENRLLAGGRTGEIQAIDHKRGKASGEVKANEDMSIEDMIRQERRTKGRYGGEGRAFAERIAKDAKFDASLHRYPTIVMLTPSKNNLDYMDENAEKLSKHVHKTDISLRNTAISDYHKTKQILDTCPLCHHEDTSTPPQAPIVSLATRVYLTIPTSPEITPYGLCASIVPIQHHLNLLQCDDNEWEEIRNFMKALSRFYYSRNPSYAVIFYENAAHEGRKRHASMEAVPLPMNLNETAPAFFRESILASDEEWAQHRKIIDTQTKASKDGMGKLAFRRSMVSELPYFHVWFTLDGGYGHIVEDPRRWPKGDLFAREIIGGMLDVGAEVIKRQGRWRKGDAEIASRVSEFQKGWGKWDWTRVLVDAH